MQGPTSGTFCLLRFLLHNKYHWHRNRAESLAHVRHGGTISTWWTGSLHIPKITKSLRLPQKQKGRVINNYFKSFPSVLSNSFLYWRNTSLLIRSTILNFLSYLARVHKVNLPLPLRALPFLSFQETQISLRPLISSPVGPPHFPQPKVRPSHASIPDHLKLPLLKVDLQSTS